MRKRARKVSELLKKLRSDDFGDIIEAGIELNLANKVRFQPLLFALEYFDNPKSREYAAYALISPLLRLGHKISRRSRTRPFARRVYIHDYRAKIARIIKVLLSVIEFDRAENVRGQALETLAMDWTIRERRHKLRKVIERSVIAALSDDSPEVRFWACFAAGNLKIEKALPKLRELAETDTADWGQWWAVSEEAEDAIEAIHGRYFEARIPFAQRKAAEG